ncbi:uncharacterized protein LOC111637945 [Centruroides sculpturatus]|uniref:uncharacterized protein LOC111637945 n=1 Tax=Centruroides sculpturatus TaxID=218467 RepID=UPI000C6DF434|nr:uncharacterized protein LOC111637945 [Centruroides sculpturatus]
MGSPISGTLCELVVRRLEQQILPDFNDDIILYARYVDDVFIVWKKKPDLAAFTETFNSNAYGLSLRAEQQSSTNVHFLDIDISLQQGRITTKVYHKSSYAPLFIHAQSHDPVGYKISAFKTLVRRAFTHCSSEEDRKMELESISNVTRLHGYPTRLTKTLIARHQQPRSTTLRNNQPFVPITYNKILHSTYKQIARYAGKNIAYRRSQTIFSCLRNDKDRLDRNCVLGIYSIPIYDHRVNRPGEYIGATTCCLKTRVKEHKYSIQKRLSNTALATFALDDDVMVEFDNARLIQRCEHQASLKYLEQLEIFKAFRKGTAINFKETDSLATAWIVYYDV